MEVSVPTVKLKKVGYAHNELALSRNDLAARSQFLTGYYLTLDSIEFTRHYAPIRHGELDSKAVTIFKNRSNYHLESSLGGAQFVERWKDLIREMVGLHALKMPWVTDPKSIATLVTGTSPRAGRSRGSSTQFFTNLPVTTDVSSLASPSTGVDLPSNPLDSRTERLWIRFQGIEFKAKDPNAMFDRILQRINLHFIENSIPACLQFLYDAQSKTLGFSLAFGYWCIPSSANGPRSMANLLASMYLLPAKLVSRKELKAGLKKRELKSASYITSPLVFCSNRVANTSLSKRVPYLLQAVPMAMNIQQFGFNPGELPSDDWFQYVAGKIPVPQDRVDPRLEILQWTKLYEFIPTIYKWLELLLRRVNPPNVLNITPIA